MKINTSVLLRSLISLSLLALLIVLMRGNYTKIISILRDTNSTLFILSVVTYFGAIVIASLRLRMIVKVQQYRITTGEATGLTFIGYFFNNFLPTAIGGDLVKAYYVTRKTGNASASFASVFMDRFLGLVTMMFMAGLALVFAKDFVKDESMQHMIYAAMILSLVFIAFLFNKRFAAKFSFLLKLVRPFEKRLKELYHAIHGYRRHRLLLLQTVTLSFVSQITYFYSVLLLSHSASAPMPMKELFLRMPLVSALSLLPSLNGLGVREGAIVAFFAPLIGKESAFAISVLVLATLMIASVAGGLIYAMSPQFKLHTSPASLRAEDQANDDAARQP